MKYQFGIVLFAFLLALVPAFPEEKAYTVKKGETIYSIARSLGLSDGELMRYNGITDPTKLRAGQKLKIPSRAEKAPPPPATAAQTAAQAGETQYRVAPKDTLYGIAKQQGVSLEALIAVNGLSESYVLREGDLLKIPSPAGSGPEAAKPAEKSAGAAAAAPAKAPAQAGTGDAGGKAAPPVTWPVTPQELKYMTGKLSGVMITGAKAETVKSVIQGTVVSAGPYRGFGKVAIVQTGGGYLYVYGGCESLLVKEGDAVGPGTGLGKLGIDAVSGKAQLFFLVYRGASPVDPAKAPRA